MPPTARRTTNTAPTETPAPKLNAVPTLEDLRAPFEPAQIGKLPRVTCRDCSNAGTRNCERHQKNRCDICRNYITSAHIHLDYVGHAAVTDRLLRVDPQWGWDPVAFDANGLPMLDAAKGLWIKLTVLGVTRYGYGSAEGKSGGDAVKELIGDALRNAAMRFGVALDLWSKEDLGVDSSERSDASAPAPGQQAPAPTGRRWLEEARRCTTEDQIIALGKACHDAGEFDQIRNELTQLRAKLHQSAPSAQ